MATGGTQPRYAHAIALFHRRHSRTEGYHRANSLVTRNERQTEFKRLVTRRCVQIGVAYTAGFGFDQYLTRPGRWDGQLSQLKRLTESDNDCSMHGGCHVNPVYRNSNKFDGYYLYS